MRVHSLPSVLIAALVMGAIPSAAHADSGANGSDAPGGSSGPNAASAASAKDLFEHGRDLRSRGDCAGALPFFQKAYALYPLGLGSLRNIAVCQETLNHAASARAAWLELRRTVATSNDPKYAGWSDDADRAMARLAPRVATLTIDLAVSSPGGAATAPQDDDHPASDGVEVTVDGQPLPKDRLDAPVEHDPGSVVVRAAGPGISAPDEQTVTLTAGESKHVALHVAIADPPPPPKPDDQAAAPPDTDQAAGHSSPLRTAAWLSVGVGVAGLAGTAVSFVLRQSALGELDASCPDHASAPCDPSKQATVNSDVKRGQTASTLLTVFGAVGIAGSVASIALFTMSRSASNQSAVVLTPAGLAAKGTF